MESVATSPPDPVVMAQQIQALIANMQELMKQNEELKRRIRPKGSNTSLHRRSHNKHNEEASNPKNSKGKDVSKYTEQSSHSNDHMMKSLRRELDEVKNTITGKRAMNLDGMLK